jgi:hypothetical protein
MADTPNLSLKDHAKRVYMEVTAAQPTSSSPATRLAYEDDSNTDAPGLKVTWKKGDKLGVVPFNNNGFAQPLPSDYMEGQGDGGTSTMTFAGTPTASKTGKYAFYHPIEDSFYSEIYEGGKIKYRFANQTCNLNDPQLANLAKLDVMYTEKAIDPTTSGTITLTRKKATTVLCFYLRLPRGAKTINRIELSAADKIFYTNLEIAFKSDGEVSTYQEGDLVNTLTLKVEGDTNAPYDRLIIAYMMYPGDLSISNANNLKVSATDADKNVYSHTFNLTASIDIAAGTVVTFAPDAELTLETAGEITRWAGSNIYWDKEKKCLTFDPAGTTTHQYYQGVFFKWGSLVGISPALTNESTGWSDDVMVYVPTYDPATPTTTTWASGKASETIAGYRGYESILPATPSDELGSYNDYIPNDWSHNTGDICQFLGKTNPALKGYRMPRDDEFGTYEEWYMDLTLNWR